MRGRGVPLLSDQDIESELSYVYLHAVAARPWVKNWLFLERAVAALWEPQDEGKLTISAIWSRTMPSPTETPCEVVLTKSMLRRAAGLDMRGG